MFNGSNLQYYEALDPVVFPDSRILILVSMPSVDSERDGFYYMDTSNRFWPTLSAIYRMPVDTIEQRKELCEKNGIALWSVAKSCMRYLSEEDTMQDIVLNNISQFLQDHPSIERILCTSHEAMRLLKSADYQAASEAYYIPSPSADDLWFDSVAKLMPEYARALGVNL